MRVELSTEADKPEDAADLLLRNGFGECAGKKRVEDAA